MLGLPNSKDKIMKTLAERLKYAMEKLPTKKIKGVDLARAVGVKPPSVSDWLSGKSKTMEGENLLKASKFLGVNANWLATGSGTATDINNKNNEEFSNILLRDFNLNKIPLINFIQASKWKEFTDTQAKLITYSFTDYLGSKPEAIFSILVQGNNMEPEFKEGDLLIVDTLLSPEPGDFVIAQYNLNKVILSKYRVLSQDKFGKNKFDLVSINKDYPTLSSETQDIRIIGTVVRHIRYFKQL